MFSANPCNTELPAVERGYVDGENHVYSHEYKVVCDSGYEPAGSPVAVCDVNGAWKPVTTCLGIYHMHKITMGWFTRLKYILRMNI